MSRLNAGMLEAGFIPGDSGAFKHDGDRKIKLYFGGGGGRTESVGTTYQTNIPEYAKPYVESMLGATQKQLFTGTPTEGGGMDITGFQPYKAYGGTYDAAGNQIAYDPYKSIAGFSPMQQQAQQSAAGLQAPGQIGMGTNLAAQGGIGSLGAGRRYERMATDPNAISNYMSPYMQNVVDLQKSAAIRDYNIQDQARKAQAVGAGAFGGSRQAIQSAEAQRALGTNLANIQAQGAQQAFQNAQQAQQFGSTLGLQGLGQGIQAAGQLGQLGAQQLGAQKDIIGLQSQMGAQQQALEQQAINQAIQDYANAQQYPLMQLGFMSNMIRGLPMQATNTQQYVPTATSASQGIGALGSLASLASAYGGGSSTAKASGGVIKMAKGGIASVPRYDVGGEIKSKLYDMEPSDLQQYIKEASSPTAKRMAERILREKTSVGMAGGGIIAFQEGNVVEDPDVAKARRDLAAAETERISPDQIRVEPAVTSAPSGINQAPPAAIPAPKPAPAAQPSPTQAALAKSSMPVWMQEMIREDVKTPRSTLDIAKERERDLATLGVESPESVAQKERARLMAEKANATDEAARMRALRAAEFFAAWGSTPGPTLQASLSALRKAIPDMVGDEKEANKIMKEINNSIANLDKATRLEKMGNYDKATEIKEKEAKHMSEVRKDIVSWEIHRATNQTTLEAARINASGRGGSKSEKDLTDAVKNLSKVEQDIAKTEGTPEFKDMQKWATRTLPADASQAAKDKQADAIKQLDQHNKDKERRLKDARELKERREKAIVSGDSDDGDTDKKTPGDSSKNEVTIGGKTYKRPAGMTDQQWADYKKSQGA